MMMTMTMLLMMLLLICSIISGTASGCLKVLPARQEASSWWWRWGGWWSPSGSPLAMGSDFQVSWGTWLIRSQYKYRFKNLMWKWNLDKVWLENLASDAQLPRKGNKCFTFNMRVCSCFGPQLTIDFWKYSQDNLKCGKCWITRIFDEPKIYLRPRGSAPGFTRPLCLNCWEAVKGARLPVSGHKDEPLHGCYPTIFSGKKLA